MTAPPNEMQITRVSKLTALALAALLTLSHWSPQGAWALQGAAIFLGVIILLLAGAGLIAAAGRPLSIHRTVIFAAAALLAWVAWWMIRYQSAPVPAIARDSVSMIVQGACVFLVTLLLSIQSHESGETGRTPVASMLIVWMAALGTLFALHALYQVAGPAAFPGTFASKLASLRENAQYYSLEEFASLQHALTEGRASGRFGSPNILAGLMAMSLPCVIGSGLTHSSTRTRLTCLAASLILFAAVIATGSRGGLAASLFAVLSVTALILIPRIRLRRSAAIVPALLFILVLTTGAANKASPPPGRWFGLSTLEQRVLYWEAGMSMWAEAPLIGRGPGAFEVFYPSHRVEGSQETRLAHNWVVEWGTATGAIGLLLFGAFLAFSLWPSLLALRRERSHRQPSSSRLFSLPSFTDLPSSLFSSPNCTSTSVSFSLSPPECTTVDASSGCRRSPLLPSLPPWLCSPSPHGGQPIPGRPSRIGIRPGPVTLSMIVTLISARTLTDRAIRNEPDNASLHLLRAHIRAEAGENDLDDLKRARALNPHSAALVETLARWQENRGNLNEALRLQREALAMHPLDAHHRMQLARLLWIIGNRDDAVRMLDSVENLKRNNQENAELQALRTQFNMPGTAVGGPSAKITDPDISDPP